MARGIAPVISAIIIICTATAANAITPSFQGIGDLPGGDFRSGAVAVSADGHIAVGGSGVDAIIWENGQMSPILEDWYIRIARDVSDDGSVVAGDGYFEVGDENTGWVYNNGEVTSFSSLRGPDGRVDVNGVSGNGSVVIGDTESVLGNEAFRWENGAMTGLGDLDGGYFLSQAYDASFDGSVIVGRSISDIGWEAFRWEDGVMTGLGDLDGGIDNSHAYATSGDGSIVVGWSRSSQGYEAFRWEGGEMVGLGDLDGGSFSSIANDISYDGSVIVGYGSSENGYEAFYWDETLGMVSLKDMLEIDFGLDLTGWTLTRALGVSADGMTIVGFGTNPDGFTEGWIATIPEPATLWLVAMGATLLQRRRKQLRQA